jgi:hypothetical protein
MSDESDDESDVINVVDIDLESSDEEDEDAKLPTNEDDSEEDIAQDNAQDTSQKNLALFGLDAKTVAKNSIEELSKKVCDIRASFVVAENDRLTSNIVSTQERTMLIGVRAKQINDDGHAYSDYGNLNDAIEIATHEFNNRRSPLILVREVGRTAANEPIVEKWVVREMAYPI